MARPQDENKRSEILTCAKRLFSRQGFHNTSISDLTRESGLPVGTIYTYFSGKEDIMVSIIETGWQEMMAALELEFRAAAGLEARLGVLSHFFFSELLKDGELINILLTEAIELTGIGNKLDRLMDMVTQLQEEARSQGWIGPEPSNLPQDRAAVVVFFMGMLHAARLSPDGELGYRLKHVQEFMQLMVMRLLASRPA